MSLASSRSEEAGNLPASRGNKVGRFLQRLLQDKSLTPKDSAMMGKINGGIDLSQQDSALHIEKDANGGVKVNVDPALIARVEREGLSEVDPVIINMQPADIQSLFGIARHAILN